MSASGFTDERRLAAIVAADAVGYSHQSEIDEAGAVDGIARLTALVEKAAAAHGGRIFNTAGDGFMLEFPSATGALAAAAEIAAEDMPVRLGVHLGEVSVTAKGDLLGHGVNLAARLCQMAEPGVVLASESAYRATSGVLRERLVLVGRPRLDKMRETVAVYSLCVRGSPRLFRLAVNRRKIAITAAALIVLIIGGVALGRLSAPMGETRVAVTRFASGQSAREIELARSLPTSIASALTERHILVVAPDAATSRGRGGAQIVVTGQVEPSTYGLRVTVRANDQRSGVTLWGRTFEHSATAPEDLRVWVSAQVADVVGAASRFLRDDMGAVEPRVLADVLQLSDRLRRFPSSQRAPANIELERSLVARAPNFADAHANLAWDLALAASSYPPAQADSMRAEAKREARTALRLDPRNDLAFAALKDLTPAEDMAERERILIKGLSVNPSGTLNGAYATELLYAGRTKEAELYLRRALALDPIAPWITLTSVFVLSGSERVDEAQQMLDKAGQLFPDYATVPRAAVMTAIMYRKPDEALAVIERRASNEAGLRPVEIAAWRDWLEAAKRGPPDAEAKRRLEAAANADIADPTTAMTVLAQLGDVDAAYRIANAALDRRVTFYPSNLFHSATASMRRDPRQFMSLAARLNLTRYWLESGKWPDFCAEDTLGYDCKEAAHRAVKPTVAAN